MTENLDFDTKVSPEGRIVLPANVRTALGVKPGDRLHITVHEGEARLVTAQTLLNAVWANNNGSDAEDSTKDVRKLRRDDQARAAAKWERVASATAEDSRSEAEIEAGLLSSLGIAQ